MEVVQNFNREMKSLLDHRPPVSRQKMSMITKSAIKGIKFYKHIVQSIEKFIQKCSPDYKVPGLYVMDAVIRQSRHQYGADRDVFAPRFLKNILSTFQQLYRCDEKDKPLIIRVLNLWLKNEMFPAEVIQSLLDLAANPDDQTVIGRAEAQISSLVDDQGGAKRQQRMTQHRHRKRPAEEAEEPEEPEEPAADTDERLSTVPQGGLISSVAELLQKFQGSDDVREQIKQLQILQEKILQQSTLLTQQQMIDPEILAQLQALMEELTKTARAAVEKEKEARRTKDVLAFDYDDSDEEVGKNCSLGVDQSFLNQLEQMTETLAQTRALQEELQAARREQQQQQDQQQQEQQQQEHQQQQHGDVDYRSSYLQESGEITYEEGEIDDSKVEEQQKMHVMQQPPPQYQYQQPPPPPPAPPAVEYEQAKHRKERSRSRSPIHHERGSRSSRRRHRSRSSERRKDRSRERKRKGLPPIKDGHLSIISTTIFVGKVHRGTTESKLRSLLDEFGDVQELLLIAPRGCAFVIYGKRKHATKALDKLPNQRLDGSALRVAWAPNKGIKDTTFKEYWQETEGCTYIPYDRFPRSPSWRNLLLGGAFVDVDTIPLELSDLLKKPEEPEETQQPQQQQQQQAQTQQPQQPIVANPPMQIPLTPVSAASLPPTFRPPPPMMPPPFFGGVPTGVFAPAPFQAPPPAFAQRPPPPRPGGQGPPRGFGGRGLLPPPPFAARGPGPWRGGIGRPGF